MFIFELYSSSFEYTVTDILQNHWAFEFKSVDHNSRNVEIVLPQIQKILIENYNKRNNSNNNKYNTTNGINNNDNNDDNDNKLSEGHAFQKIQKSNLY